MFSIEDDFDGDDKDFLDVALEFDSQIPVKTKHSVKRKSFELGEDKSHSDVFKRQKIPKGHAEIPVNSATEFSSRPANHIDIELEDDSEWNDNELSSALDHFDENCKNTETVRVVNFAKKSFAVQQDFNSAPSDCNVIRGTGIRTVSNDLHSDRECVKVTPAKQRAASDVCQRTPRSSFTFKKKSISPVNINTNQESDVPPRNVDFLTPQKGRTPIAQTFITTSTPVPKTSAVIPKIGCNAGIRKRDFKRDNDPKQIQFIPNKLNSTKLIQPVVSTPVDNDKPSSDTGIVPGKHCEPNSPVFAVSLSPISENTISTPCVSGESETKQTLNRKTSNTVNETIKDRLTSNTSTTFTLRNASNLDQNIGSSRENNHMPPPRSVNNQRMNASLNDANTIQHHTPQLSSKRTNNAPSSDLLRNPNQRQNDSISTKTVSEWDTPIQRSAHSDSSSSVAHSSSSGAGVTTKGKRKRKFPGPAGVLPRLKAGQSLAEMGAIKPADSPRPSHQANTSVEIACSQSCEDRFQEEQWVTMTRDLEPGAKDILKQFDVASVIRKASKKVLPRGKVPVICVMIDQVNTQNADASVLIRDPSGEMKGTIHRQLVKEYPAELTAGSVLVLRQCGVFSPSAKSHYLNITPKNLVRIYPKGGEYTSAIKINDFVSDDFVISETVQPKQAFQSPEPGQSLFASRFDNKSREHTSAMPFSVVGRPRFEPHRYPSIPTRPPSVNYSTPHRPRYPSSSFRNQTPQKYNLAPCLRESGTVINSTPIISPSPMPCKVRTFTPRAPVSSNPQETSLPPANAQISSSNSALIAAKGVSFTTSNPSNNNLCDNTKHASYTSANQESVPPLSGTSTLPSRTPLVQKNPENQTFQTSNNQSFRLHDDTGNQRKNTEKSFSKEAINFSIQEDMDDLLKGLDDEIFSEM